MPISIKTTSALPKIRNFAIGFAAVVALFIADGCRTIAEPPPSAQISTKIEVVDSGGREHERAVAAVAAGDEQKALLQNHLRYMAAQSGPPLIADNEVKLLIDGPQTYDAIFSALATAQSSIDVEVYIFDNDKIGRALVDLLKKKRQEGLRVRVIYDSVGCIKTPRDFFDDMREAGIQVIEFNPVNPLAGKFFNLNNRDHRKITIVDNKLAFTGGINVSAVYTHGSGISRKRKRKVDEETALADGWRDTQIQVSGPAVQVFTDLFETTWKKGGGAVEADDGKTAAADARGDKYVRVIGSSSDDKVNFIYSDLLNAIRHAQRSVRITMSYFSPNPTMISALDDAAKRGVHVELVLPGFSDSWPVLEAGRAHYEELLAAGVVIYERKDVFLHAKTAVIDGVWSTVGSSNMDMRSFLHNNEVNVIVLGNEFGQNMESMFTMDRDRAERVDPGKWSKRSLVIRIKQKVAILFSYWL